MKNPTPTPTPNSAASARGRAEQPDKPQPDDKPPFHARVRTMVAGAGSSLAKPVSSAIAGLDRVPLLGAVLRSRVAWVLVIFVIGFGAGAVWQSSGSPPGKSGASAERLKAMSLALSAARKNLDKLASDLNRLEAQGVDAPQRRSARQ